jgi:hypothetical protein
MYRESSSDQEEQKDERRWLISTLLESNIENNTKSLHAIKTTFGGKISYLVWKWFKAHAYATLSSTNNTVLSASLNKLFPPPPAFPAGPWNITYRCKQRRHLCTSPSCNTCCSTKSVEKGFFTYLLCGYGDVGPESAASERLARPEVVS